MGPKRQSYTKVPNRFADELQRTLPSTPYLVLLDIHRLTHGFHKSARRISQKTIARRLGKSYATIRRAVDYLEQQDLLISVNGSPGYSREYQLTDLALKGMLTDEHPPDHPCTPPCAPVSRGRENKKNGLIDRVKSRFTPERPKDHPSGMQTTAALLADFKASHPDAVDAGKRHASRERERARKADGAWRTGKAPD